MKIEKTDKFIAKKHERKDKRTAKVNTLQFPVFFLDSLRATLLNFSTTPNLHKHFQHKSVLTIQKKNYLSLAVLLHIQRLSN